MSDEWCGPFGGLRFWGVWGCGAFTADESGALFADAIEVTGEIRQADPRIRISGEGIRSAFGGAGLLPGAKLTVDGEGRRVVYVVGAYHEDGDWYEAEWPD